MLAKQAGQDGPSDSEKFSGSAFYCFYLLSSLLVARNSYFYQSMITGGWQFCT
jgi:hypothetical protein